MSIAFQPLPDSTLPIFRAERAGESWFYAPGYLVLASPDQAEAFAAQLAAPQPDHPTALELRQRAGQALASRQASLNEPFAPLCLTLYLNNTCNLACAYCYARPQAKSTARLSLEAIRSAAQLVAANCAEQGVRMTVVFHGGGEPSLPLARLQQALALVEGVAQAHGVGLFRYIATNGVMPAENAAWLAQHFDLIGLSCDGPPDIQARQRPLRTGESSTPWVERTARLVRQAGKPLHVRLTLTPATFQRQPAPDLQAEIAAYLCAQLRPQEIHAEPVYTPRLGEAQAGSQPEQAAPGIQAAEFVQAFLQARQVARAAGVRWSNSGSRPAELHGAYCHVFRQVLNLIPGGQATACFRLSRPAELHPLDMQIGSLSNERYTLDPARVQALRQRLNRLPEPCQTCFNQFHCTHGCPDHCLAEAAIDQLPEFRCQVSQLLALAALEACADELRLQAPLAGGVRGGEVLAL